MTTPDPAPRRAPPSGGRPAPRSPMPMPTDGPRRAAADRRTPPRGRVPLAGNAGGAKGHSRVAHFGCGLLLGALAAAAVLLQFAPAGATAVAIGGAVTLGVALACGKWGDGAWLAIARWLPWV